MSIEVRTIRGTHLRAKSDGLGARGYAAVYNTIADLGTFRERIAPGAFTRALREKADVRALINHDDNLLLGRTKSKTLRLSEDSRGLAFDCDFPDTQAARDLHVSMSRGDIDACSFGFVARKSSWVTAAGPDGKPEDIRQLEDVDLLDVSIVAWPAYEATSCEPRSLWPQGMPARLAQELRDKPRRTLPESAEEGAIARAKALLIGLETES